MFKTNNIVQMDHDVSKGIEIESVLEFRGNSTSFTRGVESNAPLNNQLTTLRDSVEDTRNSSSRISEQSNGESTPQSKKIEKFQFLNVTNLQSEVTGNSTRITTEPGKIRTKQAIQMQCILLNSRFK